MKKALTVAVVVVLLCCIPAAYAVSFQNDYEAIDRAAQFSPFAALTGYEKALEETKETAIEKVEHEIETENWSDI